MSKTSISAPVSSFTDDLLDESDCGCVLIGHAIIEEKLGEFLRQHFTQLSNAPKKLLDDLLDSGQSKPLGSFAPRAKLARALGLIDNDVFMCLTEMNSLRVKFAHYKPPRQRHLNTGQIGSLFAKLSPKRQHWVRNLCKLFKDGGEYPVGTGIHDAPIPRFVALSSPRQQFIGIVLILVFVLVERQMEEYQQDSTTGRSPPPVAPRKKQ
jgi:hypothetical protein